METKNVNQIRSWTVGLPTPGHRGPVSAVVMSLGSGTVFSSVNIMSATFVLMLPCAVFVLGAGRLGSWGALSHAWWQWPAATEAGSMAVAFLAEQMHLGVSGAEDG